MEQKNKRRYEGLALTQKVVVALYLAIAVWYLSWRPETFNPDALTFSSVLYLAECYGFFTALLHLFMVWRLRHRIPPPVPMGATVDVFVPTYNEPVEMLQRTLQAVLDMDYPHQTWLLDDGDRPAMAELAQNLGCRYLSRRERVGAKAGNLNRALRQSKADFVAVFDADHAPRRDFLQKTLGFFCNPAVALVQTPQDFYNLDSYQHRINWRTRIMFTEQSLFFRVIQRGKDYWNAAFFCGSCAVLRRDALNKIGGFATGTVTEDLHTSIRLHKSRYQSVYYPEPVAYGLAPLTVDGFLVQRLRWGRGAMQVWRRERVLTSTQLTIVQKLNYMASMLTYFDGWQKLVFYLTPAVVLSSGVLPIADVGWAFIGHLLPYYLLTFWVFEEVGRGYGHSIFIEQYNLARFAIFIRSTLGRLGQREADGFAITPKTESGVPSLRLIWPQYAVLIINGCAICYAMLRHYSGGDLAPGALAFNVFWAGVNLWLAAALLEFTVRRPRRRRSYRFPLPLPISLQLGGSGNTAYAMVRDVSPDGLRLEFDRVASAPLGQAVSGVLHLPDGGAEFEGTVCSEVASDEQNTVIGCAIQWRDADALRRVERFLYGSDLQVRINGLHEDAPTPIERTRKLFAGWRRQLALAATAWRTSLIIRSAEREYGQMLGMATSLGSMAERLLISDDMASGTVIEIHQPDGQEPAWHQRRAIKSGRLETPLAPLFIYKLLPVEVTGDAAFQQNLAGADLALGSTTAGVRGTDLAVGR